jgi:hypothetical protein
MQSFYIDIGSVSSVEGLYLDFRSVCPFVRIVSPRPLFTKRMCPPGIQRRGNTCWGVEVTGGVISDDWRESMALCNCILFGVLYISHTPLFLYNKGRGGRGGRDLAVEFWIASICKYIFTYMQISLIKSARDLLFATPHPFIAWTLSCIYMYIVALFIYVHIL